MKTTIPTQAEYEARERAVHHETIRRIEAAPLADRIAAQADFRNALDFPARISERVEWIMGGCYGRGAQMAAQAIVSHRYMNRVAALGQMVAALDHGCTADRARKAWLMLDDTRRAEVNAAIIRAMESATVDA